MKQKRSRYIIGIDLGTTNSAIAYMDTRRNPTGGADAIRTFSVPQLVAEGEVKEREGLPSFLYLSTGQDLPAGSLDLAWAKERNFAVGEFARIQGAKVPGRLVSSAKSWLCHQGVDRKAPILPWGSDMEELSKCSPVDASALYLGHVRDAWNYLMAGSDPSDRFEEQDVILTVPASFDAVARELTLDAAGKAGITRITLVEEPQAAFYSWISDNEENWSGIVGPGKIILVCDIGGGTTDFTLIRVREGDAAPTPERIAVGEHLLLGGDNMDLALARLVESRILGEKENRLDSLRWLILASLCRNAKEKILSGGDVQQVRINLPGRGKGIVAGTLSDSINMEDIEQTVINGFLPDTRFDETPVRGTGSGICEWGLPFVADPVIPRHLAAFLKKHAAEQMDSSRADGRFPLRPDAIFFNGGVFTPRIIRKRISAMLSNWFSHDTDPAFQPLVLENNSPALAVARGATYYGMVRRGRGVRIVGGCARSYYVKVARDDAALEPGQITAACVIPRGMEEGEEMEIESPEFKVLTNQPVSFSVYSSNSRKGDRLGEILRLSADSLFKLPPLQTILRFGKKGVVRKLPVHIETRLTEIGTLDVSCLSVESDHRWRLQFQIRSDASEETKEQEESGKEKKNPVSEESTKKATQAIKLAFGMKEPSAGQDVTAENIITELRARIGRKKERWPVPVLRHLSDTLLEGLNHRKKTARHEERWLNLTGFCLRPGYGYAADDWRMREVWKVYGSGILFAGDKQGRVEWWTLWRRVAGGLAQNQQMEIFRDCFSALAGAAKKGKKHTRILPMERTEMWRTIANLERLPLAVKEEIAAELLKHIGSARGEGLNMWVLSRIGSRVPLYGPLDAVIPGNTVTKWIERILATEWKKPDHTGFCVVQMACLTGDRERDIHEQTRHRIRERVIGLKDGERLAKRLNEMLSLSALDQNRVFGESLPEGLHL